MCEVDAERQLVSSSHQKAARYAIAPSERSHGHSGARNSARRKSDGGGATASFVRYGDDDDVCNRSKPTCSPITCLGGGASRSG